MSKEKNNFLLLVLDSCRYDSVKNVWNQLEYLPQLGDLELAHTFATWTLPSHMDFLAGRLPWKATNNKHITRGGGRLHLERVGELKQWKKRLNIENSTIIDDQYRIHKQLHKNKYTIKAITSASPLGPNTMFSELIEEHHHVGSKGDSLLRGIEYLNFSNLSFYIFNTCETHYPYWTPGYDPKLENIVLSGLRGLAKATSKNHLKDIVMTNKDLRYLHNRQQDSVKYVDKQLPELIRKLPRNTSMVITADHGEAFGEGGYIGHGEIAQDIVLQVPFIEVSPENIISLKEKYRLV